MSHRGGGYSGSRDGYGGGGGSRGGYDDRGRQYDRGHGDSFRDRSRSRDYEDRRGRFHGGERGGRGRGRVGRGGRGGRGTVERPRSMPVMTNFFKLSLVERNFVRYYVQIENARKVRVKNPETGEFVRNPETGRIEVNYEVLEKKVDLNIATTLARRCLQKLKEDFFRDEAIAFDGSSTLIAAKSLPYQSEEKTEEEEDETMRFFVTVKKNCDENDSQSDRVKNAHFRISLKKVDTVQLPSGEEDIETYVKKMQPVRQAMDIVLKSASFAILNAYGKSPRRFYFNENEQVELLGMSGRAIDAFKDPSGRQAPFVGITHATKFCNEGSYVNTDTCVNFFDRDYYYSRTPGENRRRVPLLEQKENHIFEIAGVRVRDFRSPITDRGKQQEIETAIRKLTFDVEYKRKPSREWEQRQRDRGRSKEEIARMCLQVRKNCTMKVDSNGHSIIWAADDPNMHSFEVKPRRPLGQESAAAAASAEDAEDLGPPVTYTVYEYFRERHGLKLKYPKMPLIYTKSDSRGEWFPIEFLFQAFSKSKDANSPSQVQQILNFYDSISGSRSVEKAENIMRKFTEQNRVRSLLRQFNMICDLEPTRLEAKVLQAPTLHFGNGHRAELRNGSWNLNRVQFETPSDMKAFAVVDFCQGESERFMTDLLRVMKSHGMETPFNIERHLRSLIFPQRDTSSSGIYDAFRGAIANAKNIFWRDRENIFRRNHVWFRTHVTSKEGETAECLLFLLENELGAILRQNTYLPTHIFFTRSEGKEIKTRLQVEVTNPKTGDRAYVDPFDFRFVEGVYQVMINGNWEEARFVKHVFREIHDGSLIRTDEMDQNRTAPAVPIVERQISPFFMVFVYLPDNRKETYDLVKMMGHFHFGVPTQCVVSQTYQKQKRGVDQFCSNISLKVNTKLMTRSNCGRAWATQTGGQGGLEWLQEAPTMILGIALSHGLGQESITVIGASVGLDPCCMQIAQELKVQSKSSIIATSVMMDLFKALFQKFYSHTKQKPARILVYRSGASDGDFPRILQQENGAIRQALFEILSPECDNNCKKRGCPFCTPPITFVVCQTQHNIRIVPSERVPQLKDNVHSGTCLDHTILDISGKLTRLKVENDGQKTYDAGREDLLFDKPKDDGYDFLLTAQGGLKGTSKPVYYRVLLNENVVWKRFNESTPLTKDRLEILTYQQCHQYGTASKSVRLVPVVKYAERLANMGMGYINYLRGKKGDEESVLERVELEDVDDDEKEFLPLGRDGQLLPRYKLVRRERRNLNLPPEIKYELLPAFSTYDNEMTGPGETKGKFYYPHGLSA